MNKFEGEPRIEPNPVDKDFNSLEQDFAFADRLEMVRDLSAEIFYGQASERRQQDFSRGLKYPQATGQEGLRHYLLPDIPGGEGDIKSVREVYDSRARYIATPERVLIKVGQGEMWAIPKDKNPFMCASLSECSVLIGVNQNELVVAHISYSALNETEAALRFMDEKGITPEHVQAVASIGSYQAERSAKDFNKRAIDDAAYEKLGIKPEHIHAFAYQPEAPKPDGSWTGRNLTQVAISKDGFWRWSFDLENAQRSEFTLRRDGRLRTFNNEEAVEFDK